MLISRLFVAIVSCAGATVHLSAMQSALLQRFADMLASFSVTDHHKPHLLRLAATCLKDSGIPDTSATSLSPTELFIATFTAQVLQPVLNACATSPTMHPRAQAGALHFATILFSNQTLSPNLLRVVA